MPENAASTPVAGEQATWGPAANLCKGLGALAYPILEPLTWGNYEWRSWSEDRRHCYGMLAETGFAAASFGVSFAAPRSSPVFGAGSFDRFFRDALRSRSKTDNFFNGTIGSLYTPMFASAGALLVSAGIAGAEAYEDTLTRALPLLWLALAGNALATGIAKKSFGRERPYLKFDNQRGIDVFGTDDDSRQSFYSGHASTAFLGASFIDPVVADMVRSAEPRYALVRGASWSLRLLRLGQALALYGLASAVAYSRIEIDLHYMTDVLAGAAVGTLHGQLLYHWSYRRYDAGLAVSAMPHGRGLQLTWRFGQPLRAPARAAASGGYGSQLQTPMVDTHNSSHPADRGKGRSGLYGARGEHLDPGLVSHLVHMQVSSEASRP